MNSIKKCKGSGKAKGYGCGSLLNYREYNGMKKYDAVYGLGRPCGCYSKWLLNTEEGKSLLAKATLKAIKPRLELEKATAESREKKSVSWVIKYLVNLVHKYIKMRDKGLPCISCGAQWHSDFQAGHFFKAELYSELRFHEHNINAQCPKCNMFMEGNLNQYAENLEKKIGAIAFSKLKDRAANSKKNTLFKWDRKRLDELKEYYRNKIQENKSQK